jgi:hypothetical protein
MAGIVFLKLVIRFLKFFPVPFIVQVSKLLHEQYPFNSFPYKIVKTGTPKNLSQVRYPA